MDVEKAREHMRTIMQACEGGTNYASVMKRHADEALRALDGEGVEEWTVTRWSQDEWLVQGHDQHSDTLGPCTLARCSTEATARRIARLPALERAAQAVVARPLPPTATGAECEAFSSLRAALETED